MTDQQKETIRRLQAIIDGTPYEGERIAAQEALKRIMAKYSITEKEISDSDTKEYEINLGSSELVYNLRNQVFCNFMTIIDQLDQLEKGSVYHYVIGKRAQKTNFTKVKLTPAQFIELEARIDFFEKAFFDQVNGDFFYAFVKANGLFRGLFKDEVNKPPKDKTEEQIRGGMMSNFVKKSEFHQQIKGSSVLMIRGGDSDGQ